VALTGTRWITRGAGPMTRAPGALSAAWVVAAVLALTACKRSAEPPAGIGKAVFTGPARALAASSDGAWLAILDGCQEVKVRFLPAQTASCDLRVVASQGGDAPRKVASGVPTLPHGFGWAPTGDVLAALAEFDYAAAAGTLVVARGGGEAARIADGVTFHGFVPGSERVAAIAGGRLVLATPGRPPEWIPGVDGLSSFDFDPRGPDRARGDVAALLRRSAQGGGALLAVRGGDADVSEVAARAGDYGFSPDGGAFAVTVREGSGYELRLGVGARQPRALGRDVRAFAFSPDGGAIAFVAGAQPGTQGDLHVAPVGAGGDTVLGREVGEFRWARAAPRLAWLERYDPRVRAGTLGAGGPGFPARTFAANVSDFDVSPEGKHVAFLQHTTRGGYSVDLGVARLDAPADARFDVVARGVFGFSFSPDARWLYYRTRCIRNAEACDLERIPAAGLPPGGVPEPIAPGVKSFEFDPHDPDRLLVTWQRADMVALDVGVWERGRLISVDTAALPGSIRFLGPDSRRITYVVVHPKRQGVYVADLPGAARAPAR
jgi:hypothetical protein